MSAVAGPVPFDFSAVWNRISKIPPPDTTRPEGWTAKQLTLMARPIPQGCSCPGPKPVPLPLPTATASLDTFLDRLAGTCALIGLAIMLFALPVGIACFVGFGIWYFSLVFSRKGRIRAQRASHDAERKQVEELNALMNRRWEEENPIWVDEYRKRLHVSRALDGKLAAAELDHLNLNKSSAESFRTIREGLDARKTAYEKAKAAYEKDVADLRKRSAQIQRDHYLDSFLISDAKLAGIRTDRIASLSSFGIETALDVRKLENIKVPGIGPVLMKRLLDWRDSQLRYFKPQPGVPVAEHNLLDQRHFPRLHPLEAALAEGPRRLLHVVEQHESKKKDLLARMEYLAVQAEQARLDVKIMDQVVAPLG